MYEILFFFESFFLYFFDCTPVSIVGTIWIESFAEFGITPFEYFFFVDFSFLFEIFKKAYIIPENISELILQVHLFSSFQFFIYFSHLIENPIKESLTSFKKIIISIFDKMGYTSFGKGNDLLDYFSHCFDFREILFLLSFFTFL